MSNRDCEVRETRGIGVIIIVIPGSVIKRCREFSPDEIMAPQQDHIGGVDMFLGEP